MGYENCGKHPNSLKQLKPYMDSEKAKEMQAKGAETRRQNRQLRDSMKLSASEFRKIRDEIITEMPTAVEILKVQLIKAMQLEDQDTIERLAIALAEYEQPKLQRVDQTTRNLDTSELSEEELDRKIKELSDGG
jgi:ribonuclease HII